MFKIEINVRNTGWKQVGEAGNIHAAEVFAAKRKDKRVLVRVVDTLGFIVVEA